MTKEMTLDYEQTARSIRNIVEDVSNIVSASTTFRGELESAYDTSQLTFLRNVSEAMGTVESASKQLQATFVEIQEGLRSYIRQFDDYDNEKGMF